MTYRKLSSAELGVMGGAFAAGYESERAQQLFVPELSFSPRMDLSLALGWPFLLELEPPSGAADPVKETFARLTADLPARRWPIDLATRAVRALAHGYEDFPQQPTPEAVTAASREEPFAASEVKSILATLFANPQTMWAHPTWLLGALEALADGGAVVEAMLESLEAGFAGSTTMAWGRVNPTAAALVKRLAYVVRRLDPAAVAPARARAKQLLGQVIDKRPTLMTDDKFRLVPYRGLALLAADEETVRAGVARIDGELRPDDSVFLSRKSFLGVVRSLGKPLEGEQPTAQWVVAGGTEVLDIELGRWNGYGVKMDKAAAHAHVLEQYGVFRQPGAVVLVADMAAKSQAKPAALAWLSEHAAFATPVLSELAKSKSPAAASAGAALQKLAKQKPA